MSFYRYCPKCGYITPLQDREDCYFCNETLLVSDYNTDDLVPGINPYIEIFEKNIKFSSTFSHYLYSKRKEKFKNYDKTAQSKTVFKCPSCGSTNIHPISMNKKTVGYAIRNLFINDSGKTIECYSCGYKW